MPFYQNIDCFRLNKNVSFKLDHEAMYGSPKKKNIIGSYLIVSTNYKKRLDEETWSKPDHEDK